MSSSCWVASLTVWFSKRGAGSSTGPRNLGLVSGLSPPLQHAGSQRALPRGWYIALYLSDFSVGRS